MTCVAGARACNSSCEAPSEPQVQPKCRPPDLPNLEQVVHGETRGDIAHHERRRVTPPTAEPPSGDQLPMLVLLMLSSVVSSAGCGRPPLGGNGRAARSQSPRLPSSRRSRANSSRSMRTTSAREGDSLHCDMAVGCDGEPAGSQCRLPCVRGCSWSKAQACWRDDIAQPTRSRSPTPVEQAAARENSCGRQLLRQVCHGACAHERARPSSRCCGRKPSMVQRPTCANTRRTRQR